jgi:hypothetical protein
MAKTKTKPDSRLYQRLRDNGVRKRIAARAADALPAKGTKSRRKAESIADDLTKAADSIRDRVGGGSRKRSNAAAKAARTRKAKAAKRSRAARKGAKTRARS